MKLSEIVGQERAIATLRESMAQGRLHHALLFAGPEGTGKRTTALALAAALLCSTRNEIRAFAPRYEMKMPVAPGRLVGALSRYETRSGDSCGTCAACVQVAAGSHPDLRFETLAKDRRDVSIDQVREIQAALGRSALARGKKIAIVDEAQALSEPAQNAFLKTLEEPPGDTLLVLVAHNVTALVATVRSRCQRIAFSPLDTAEIERILRERHGRSPDDARLLARWADGSLGLALDADPAALREATEALGRTLEGLDPRGYGDVVDAARSLASAAQPFGLPLLLKLLRERLRAAAGAGGDDELTRRGKPVSLASALRAAEHAYRASTDLRRNANPAIALERMWLGITESLGG